MEAVRAEQVRRYFDAEADRFDAIYRSDKGLTQRLVDGLFRGVIHRRYELTMRLCGEVTGKRVLDVGCGSGRYALELARRGAQVVGLDFAPAMVEMARARAASLGVAERCRFEVADFLSWGEPGHFDICLGIGLFDYIAAPQPLLAKMRSLTAERGVFSFPVRWTVRSFTRRVRLTLNRCPVHFYGMAQVQELLRQSGWRDFEIHRLSRDYLADAHCGATPAAA
ncbi:MAG: methyltransferase domain-containing protein [Gemmatimonadota bacterium]